jgi:hypothetical protein
MSATTRSLGYNWLLKYWSVNPTCTTCTTDTDAISFTVGTCTTIGGMDNLDIGGSREMIDVTSFEDTIIKQVPGRISLDVINVSGNYDYTCSAQKALQTDIFKERGVSTSTSATVRVFSATDTVGKRKYSWKGYVTAAKLGVPVKGKATFSASIVPISKVMVCTIA